MSSPSSPELTASLSPTGLGQLYRSHRPPSSTGSYSYTRSPDTSIYDPAYLAGMSTPIRSPDFDASSASIDYSGAPDWMSPSSELFPKRSARTDLNKRRPSPNSSPPISDSNSDSDDDGHDEDPEATIHSRQRIHTVSTTSLMASPEERLEALQRTNAELAKKVRDVSRELENKLSDHEGEIEEMQTRIENLRSELSASKRDGKELRIKAVRVKFLINA